MFRRFLLDDLRAWRESRTRKPLVLRGARQTGKTTLIHQFGTEFEQYLYFNLERLQDRRLFEQELPFERLLEALFFSRDASRRAGSTLVFLDEIQESPRAMGQLRYFHEEASHLCVVAAGSLLEVVTEQRGASFPVGRVEYRHLFPLSFREYLAATAPASVQQAFDTVPVPEYAISTLVDAFHQWVITGGMPGLLSEYLDSGSVPELTRSAGDLLHAFVEDAGKYARNSSMFQTLRFAIETAPSEAGNRIKFQGFGNSTYRSREMGEALRTLERAMLLYLVHPTTSTELPMTPDRKKPPRLQFLDTGLVNMGLGLTPELVGVEDLFSVYRGRIVEHAVAQELLGANDPARGEPPLFWVREKANSQAEIDFVIPYGRKLIPVEVKSGPTGRLRSLHHYVEHVVPPLAVRLYRGPVRVDPERTPGGAHYTLLSLPYVLAAKLPDYIAWALGPSAPLSTGPGPLPSVKI